MPDFGALRRQREQHRDLTLDLLWQEYREQNPEGYSYSAFCKLYRRWKKRQDVMLHQEHRPGEKLFLDWAGATIPIHLADGGVAAAPLFVSALGVSSYTHAEAVPNQQMENWLKVQMNALEFYGGCPRLLIPDNTRTGVSRACIYEPDLNPTYQEFAAHYRVGVLPARPRKPRDKAKVESAVQVVQRWIVMRLRSRGRNQPVTQAEHRPKSHQAHLEWTPSRMVEWSAKVGPRTGQLVARILDSKPHPEAPFPRAPFPSAAMNVAALRQAALVGPVPLPSRSVSDRVKKPASLRSDKADRHQRER